MVRRRLNRKLLDEWIEKHGPDGVSQLAIESKVSSSTIQKVRATEKAPKKHDTQSKMAVALGVKIDELFPEAGAKGRAS